MLKGFFGKKDAISSEGCADTVDLVEARAAKPPSPLATIDWSIKGPLNIRPKDGPRR